MRCIYGIVLFREGDQVMKGNKRKRIRSAHVVAISIGIGFLVLLQLDQQIFSEDYVYVGNERSEQLEAIYGPTRTISYGCGSKTTSSEHIGLCVIQSRMNGWPRFRIAVSYHLLSYRPTRESHINVN